jgi:hypothetical protein
MLPLVVGAVAVLLLVALVYREQKQTPALPLRHTFDQSTDSWIAFGDGAQVRTTTKAADVKTGTGALELEYQVGPGRMGSAVLPVTSAALARMQALRFWIKSDIETTVGVVLSETQPGGIYAAWFWVPRMQWQHVELLASDFALNEGPQDPPDANGRMDLDRLQGVGFIDLGQFFALLSQDPTYPLVLTKPTGTHYFHIDDFEVLPTVSADRPLKRDLIGDPGRGVISWITLGGAELSLNKDRNPLNSVAFQATYEQVHGKYVLLAHGLSTLKLEQAAQLKFDVASSMPATIMVYLEERSPGNSFGPRYSTVTTLGGGSQAEKKTLPLSGFKHDSTGPADPDGRLNPDRLKSISFVDVTAATSGPPKTNTLWFSGIEALAR